MERRNRLEPYSAEVGKKGCRNCIYRQHPDNRVASVCTYDGLVLSECDVFAKVCKYWKAGKVA